VIFRAYERDAKGVACRLRKPVDAAPRAASPVYQESGQAIVFFVLVVAAAEVVVGLGIIVALMRRRPGATADDISLMRG